MSGYWYPSVRSYQVSASTIKSIQKTPALYAYKPVDYDLHIPLQGLAEEGRATLCSNQSRITVGMATCARAAGALTIYKSLVGRNWEEKARVNPVGCLGACYAEPFVTIRTPDGMHYFYGNVDSSALWSIIKTAQGMTSTAYLWAVAQERKIGVVRSIHDLALIQIKNSSFQEFFRPQIRRISGRCGLVDPENIAEYVAMDGYFALKKVLFQLKVEDIMKLITAAGLRGRGGAGFLTGDKWKITAQSSDPIRYVVANADEGDPGAYMDRALLESDPHSVLEGLMIAAYAVGASQGYIFVRHEYPLAIQALGRAIADARKVGLLGANILGSNFSLEITLIASGGAFVCGEETSLLQIMDNKRGEPQQRPPYPAIRGLRNHPTLINNVETLANIPWIVLHGAAAFREAGTEKSPGTKIFCLTGDVKRMGFIEVPLGINTKVLAEQIGGTRESTIKALQIGGPSGGIIPYSDFALDYETMASTAAIMGSGGLVVLGHNRCMVDLARHLVGFMAKESCGKCTICRDGLAELEDKLLLLTMGKAQDNILNEIKELSQAIQELSQCGLGQTAANPVISTLRDFSKEYEAHVKGRCPAVTCKPLIDFEIILPCRMCRACYTVCPTGAVKMREGKERILVDRKLCTKCWACYEACPFNFIRITSEEYQWKDS